jgi:hypothetical protein
MRVGNTSAVRVVLGPQRKAGFLTYESGFVTPTKDLVPPKVRFAIDSALEGFEPSAFRPKSNVSAVLHPRLQPMCTPITLYFAPLVNEILRS